MSASKPLPVYDFSEFQGLAEVREDGSLMMRRTVGSKGLFILLVALAVAAGTGLASPPSGSALAEGTDLWGGPGARGTGAFGATFNTTVYVSTKEATTGTVSFWSGGRVAGTVGFTTGAGPRSVSVPSPDAVDGQGAFLWQVHADRPVSAWSMTFNSAAAGDFGVGLPGFPASDFLVPGDEAAGAPVPASTSDAAGQGRTNVGVLCSPLSAEPCSVDVVVSSDGASIGTGRLSAAPGTAAQQALSALVPAAAGRSSLNARFRVLAGTALPYAIRNDNKSSDPIAIPLTVARGAFSAAPRIDVFTASPVSGCAPLATTLVWSTTNAARVAVSGLGTSFPPAGSVQATYGTSTDVVLTAFSASGASTSQPLRVSVLPATTTPTPSPSAGSTIPGSTITGVIPAGLGDVAVSFDQQQSTGSTFVMSGNTFVYTAGSTAGTDIVRLTATGPCASASATFTATVAAGQPLHIDSFQASVARACNLTDYNIIVTWAVTGTPDVGLLDVANPLPPSGWYPFFFLAGSPETVRTFTLRAPFAKPGATQTISVPVDTRGIYPFVTPSFIGAKPGQTVSATVSLDPPTADPNKIIWSVQQAQSYGSFNSFYYPTFVWNVGPAPNGGLDVIRFTYTNGCGAFTTDLKILSIP